MERLKPDVDVLIVGAGLSGVAAAHYVQTKLPHASYAIVEARDAIGGTWDLFRYPGVRADSDMQTLGYSFRPWRGDVALAPGDAILRYIRETAREENVEGRIQFGRRVTAASWSSRDACWTVLLAADSTTQTLRCSFLFMCTGYYEYGTGYVPEFAGIERYRGVLVHPQAWPRGLDYRSKRVLVIGSGATAITIVPALAREASQVTMLQRSPTYVLSLPRRDALGSRLPYPVVRWRNILRQQLYYTVMRLRPEAARAYIKRINREAIGPDYDVDTHFTPRYQPWDQRFCFVPDGDFFRALRDGKASIETGEIESFTETGVRLRSGKTLDADIAVTATGFNMRLMPGVQLSVDGVAVELSKSVAYKGMMLCGVPNMAMALGYTNASWTLKCELTARYVCRLLAYMRRRGFAYCVAREPDASIAREGAVSLTSGYVKRAEAHLPKQGARAPWRVYQNYARDLAALRFGRLRDGVMQFVR